MSHRNQPQSSCRQAAPEPCPGGVRGRDAVFGLLCCFALTGCAKRELTWEFMEDAPQGLSGAHCIEVTNRLSIMESDTLEGRDEQSFLDQIYAALRAHGYADRIVPTTQNVNAAPAAGITSGAPSVPAAPAGDASGGTDSYSAGSKKGDPACLRFEFSMLVSQTCLMDMIEPPFSLGPTAVSKHWLHRVKEITLSIRSVGDQVVLGTVKVSYPELQKDVQGPLKDILRGVDMPRQRTRCGKLELTGAPGALPANP
jgi:hypothetical protein